ncbi:MAG: D-aminoacyl-tRNA deacylase, partial [Bacillota bacterium]
MKVLVQRVKHASCVVNNQTTGAIEQGLLLFISFNQTDTDNLIPYMAKKVANLRILEDDQGKMNLSIKTLDYPVLSIPQFTLEADTKKGNRP